MSKRNFDLGSMLAAVSNLDTSAAAPEVRMIPIEDIIPNKANFYQIDKEALKPLADSIVLDGLHHYPLVMPSPTKEGKYQLIDGERRYTAIKLLVEDPDNPRKDLRLVPCTVRQYKSAAMAELQLILSNSTNRVLTNAEVMQQASKMEMLLYQLKEEGYEFPGRMRDQVAAACKVSAPKLARLKVIEKHLILDFMHLFQKNKLPEQTAYALARLPAEFQRRVSFSMPPGGVPGYAADTILARYEKGWRWDAKDLTCPDGKACKRGDTFLRHDLEHYHEMCGGNTCCLKCDRASSQWCPCDRMCSKAKVRRKDAKDERDARELAARTKVSKKYEAETLKNAERLLRAIEAAGLPDDAEFRWREYWPMVSVATVRKWAVGEFDELLTKSELPPEKLEAPVALAELLGCSTDYLLGLTDELKPREQRSTPPAEGWLPLKFVDGRKTPPRGGELILPCDADQNLYDNLECATKMMTIAVNRGLGIGRKRFEEKVNPELHKIEVEFYENRRTADQEYALAVVDREYSRIMEE